MLKREITVRGPVTLLKNYAPARQHSLNAYGEFLEGILEDAQLLGGSWRPRGLHSLYRSDRRPSFVAASIDKYGVAPVEAAFHSADVLHIIDNSNAWYSFTSRYRQLIVTVHDLIAWKCVNGLVEGWNPSRAARAVLRLNFAAMRKADVLLAVSDTTRRDLLAAGFDDRKVRVIHNCVLNPPLSGDGARWAGIDLSTTFVHYGAGKYPKHSELVVEAFAHTQRAFPSARLIMVGPRAAELTARLGTSGSTEAYDNISGEEVRFLYDHVVGVLMPSRYEGFGLPVLEAQENSCLIVTSDGGALDEVMQDGPLKLRRPIVAENLAQVMVKILTDRSFCEAMRELGRANAARFSRVRAQRAYHDFYREVCRA